MFLLLCSLCISMPEIEFFDNGYHEILIEEKTKLKPSGTRHNEMNLVFANPEEFYKNDNQTLSHIEGDTAIVTPRNGPTNIKFWVIYYANEIILNGGNVSMIKLWDNYNWANVYLVSTVDFNYRVITKNKWYEILLNKNKRTDGIPSCDFTGRRFIGFRLYQGDKLKILGHDSSEQNLPVALLQGNFDNVTNDEGLLEFDYNLKSTGKSLIIADEQNKTIGFVTPDNKKMQVVVFHNNDEFLYQKQDSWLDLPKYLTNVNNLTIKSKSGGKSLKLHQFIIDAPDYLDIVINVNNAQYFAKGLEGCISERYVAIFASWSPSSLDFVAPLLEKDFTASLSVVRSFTEETIKMYAGRVHYDNIEGAVLTIKNSNSKDIPDYLYGFDNISCSDPSRLEGLPSGIMHFDNLRYKMTGPTNEEVEPYQLILANENSYFKLNLTTELTNFKAYSEESKTVLILLNAYNFRFESGTTPKTVIFFRHLIEFKLKAINPNEQLLLRTYNIESSKFDIFINYEGLKYIYSGKGKDIIHISSKESRLTIGEHGSQSTKYSNFEEYEQSSYDQNRCVTYWEFPYGIPEGHARGHFTVDGIPSNFDDFENTQYAVVTNYKRSITFDERPFVIFPLISGFSNFVMVNLNNVEIYDENGTIAPKEIKFDKISKYHCINCPVTLDLIYVNDSYLSTYYNINMHHWTVRTAKEDFWTRRYKRTVSIQSDVKFNFSVSRHSRYSHETIYVDIYTLSYDDYKSNWEYYTNKSPDIMNFTNVNSLIFKYTPDDDIYLEFYNFRYEDESRLESLPSYRLENRKNEPVIRFNFPDRTPTAAPQTPAQSPLINTEKTPGTSVDTPSGQKDGKSSKGSFGIGTGIGIVIGLVIIGVIFAVAYYVVIKKKPKADSPSDATNGSSQV